MRLYTIFCLSLLIGASSASAAFVTPQMGGGQVSQGSVSMKHADISFSSNTISVHVDNSVGTPILRPLEAPDEFDPAQSWSVLGTKAYNFQYGWNPSGFIIPPLNAWIWIEQLSATPGLEVYKRPPATPSYGPMFGTGGTSTRWRWGGSMTHNVYAVQDPIRNLYEATYRVYIGNDITGEPLLGYTSDEVTFEFMATPILHADFDDNGYVNGLDLAQWEGDFAANSDSDADADGDSDGADFLTWQREMGAGMAPAYAVAVVPEPSTTMLFIVAIVSAAGLRRC